MKISIIVYFIGLGICIGSLLSCNKKEFLDKKPSSDLYVPTTLEDFQYLLDNDVTMSETPVMGELSADNYYLNDLFWDRLNAKEKNSYTWAADIYQGEGNVPDWNSPYKQVFYANVILDGLDKMSGDIINTRDWNIIKGSAHFIRAYAFHNLAQVFAPAYDTTIADIPNLGIPLRLTPNIDEPTRRSTVDETYLQILNDLKEASRLLNDSISIPYRNRPSKSAALAMLARVYLSMRVYDKASEYADSSLRLYNTLMDYNDKNIANPTGTRPFDKKNPETLYSTVLHLSTTVFVPFFVKDCVVDTILYRSYAPNDLRRTIFYTTNASGQPINKGTYSGALTIFSGLATDEVWLIKAECNARAGLNEAAVTIINSILGKRFRTGTFVPHTVASVGNVLDFVLNERRKELPFRSVRWSDLRRLNKEGYNIKLKRILHGQSYELLPNSSKYVLPIPSDVIAFTGIPQNQRN
jgi:starch-binding outer membrane protein, SusD/RagB family